MLKDTDVPIAPSTHYASKTRPPSRRSVTDAETTCAIERVHRENYGVYGIRKVWAQLGREGGADGLPVARRAAARLMKAAGLRGVSRVKTPRTTVRGAGPDLRPDLVERAFTAPAPNRLWVADITYIKTCSGRVYASFVLDMGIWTRRHAGDDLTQLIHHSDRGVQYVTTRYTERLSEVDPVASVGSVADSYDNAMAEASNSPFKAEPVRNRGPWNGINDLELAVAEYIDWHDHHRRLHSELELVPPVEHEALHAAQNVPRQHVEAGEPGLHQTRHLTDVKGGRPTLRHELAGMPSRQVGVGHRGAERGHGRREIRTLKVVTIAAGSVFPHAAQAIRLVRRRRPPTSGKWHTETVYAITDLRRHQARPEQLAGWIRGHRQIENGLRWVRDVTYAEDASQVRTGHAPQVMASLRNFATSAHRLAGAHDIAAALRHCSRNSTRVLAILKIAR